MIHEARLNQEKALIFALTENFLALGIIKRPTWLPFGGVNLGVRLYFIAIGMTGFGNGDISVGDGFCDAITKSAAGDHPDDFTLVNNIIDTKYQHICRNAS